MKSAGLVTTGYMAENPLRLLYRCRHMLLATSAVEIRSRYSGTLLGLGWAVLYPFLFLGLYAVVYGLILRVRLAEYTPVEYIVLIFAGLIPFIGFSEALATSVTSVSSNRQLIRNTLYPIELVPVKAVISSSLSMAVALCGLLLLQWSRGQIYPTQLLVVPLVVLQLALSIGVGWVLSAVNVFFRDVAQAIGIFVLFLMIVSPIGYTSDMIPHQLLLLAYVNPLYYLIELYRDALVFGVVKPGLWLAFVAIAAAAFWFGHDVFRRLKPIFAEHV